MNRSLRRTGIAVLIAVVGVSAVTASPILSLWLGSLAQGGSATIKFNYLVIVIVSLISLSILHLRVIAILNAAYEREAGIVRARTPLGWLRSMRDDARHKERPMTVPEAILVALVVILILVFLVWFFTLAHTNIP
jgi:hypothetical protein